MASWASAGTVHSAASKLMASNAAVAAIEPQAAYTEALRVLCTSLMQGNNGGPCGQVLLITSPISGEGKSMLSTNLAIVYAQRGKTVLLIDGDLRTPVLHQSLNLESGQGLSSLLFDGDVDEVASAVQVPFPGIPGLYVLPAGPVPAYPAELLASDGMAELIRICRRHYDYIIIDGAPILPVTDSALLSRYADFTLVVARHNVTDRRSLERTCQILRSQGVRDIGMVLNGVKASVGAQYRYYGYKQSSYTGATSMRRHKSIFAFLVFSALTVPCLAQQESLLIGPGDLIQVDVMDTPEMEQQVRVTDDGTVPLAYIGNIHVAGETPAEAAAGIQKALIEKKVMHQPQVTVRMQELATQDVSVLGQVRTPGTYSITTPQTILKVLSLAGGLTDTADRNVVVKRHKSAEQVKYYVSNDAEQALSDVVMVYPGDTVLVSRAPMVYVMGDVNRPGGYAIATNDEHLSVLQLIAMAGSANKTSVQSRVRLIRTTDHGQVELPVRLDQMEKGKQPPLMLQVNDIVYVPFSWVKNVAMSSASIAASTAGAAIYVVH